MVRTVQDSVAAMFASPLYVELYGQFKAGNVMKGSDTKVLMKCLVENNRYVYGCKTM